MPLLRVAPCLIVVALAGSSLRPQDTLAPALPPSPPIATAPGDRPAARSDWLAGPFPADVLSIVDGDTLDMRVTIWLGQQVVTRVRLRGIDAPELGAGCAEERHRAVLARDALEALALARPLVLTQVGSDKYGGRVLARLQLPDGTDAGQALLSAGHARPYGGGRRESWCASVSSRR